MSKSPYDWTQFKKQIFIKADVDRVFNAWAKPGQIIRWFIAQAEYTDEQGKPRRAADIVQAGDQYHWRWHQDLEAKGEVLEVVPGAKLRFTFGDKEPGSAEKIIVTVRCAPYDAESKVTLLELTQENMADTAEAHTAWHLGCNLGWSFFMTNLKGLLEHGIDLRETDPDLAYASRAISL